jgi:hypothetical protein
MPFEDRRLKNPVRATFAVLIFASLAVVLSSCSLNTLIWGADGAEVIETTDRFAEAAAEGDASSYICAGHDPRLGEPAEWEGVTGEEPERFVPEYWPTMVLLDPTWSINVYVPVERQVGGMQIPSDVFYRQSDQGLCVVDVVWATVASIN